MKRRSKLLRWLAGRRRADAALRLLLVGPVPPPWGGATVCFKHLLEALHGQAQLCVVDTKGRAQRPLSRVWSGGKKLARVGWGSLWCDVACLHASNRTAMRVGAALVVLGKTLGKPTVVRVFGCSLDEHLAATGRLEHGLARIAMRADVVFIECEGLRRRLAERFPSSRLEGFPNSRPTPRVLPPERTETTRFVFLSQLMRSKGLLDVLAAVERLREVGIQVQVDVYGPLVDVPLSELSRQAGVDYRGLAQPEDLAELFSRADAILLPTRYPGEGHPGCLIEAISYGVPAIATRWRYVPEVIQHEINGLLVEPGDVEQLTDAMRRFVEEPALANRLSEGATSTSVRFRSELWNRDTMLAVCNELASGI